MHTVSGMHKRIMKIKKRYEESSMKLD